ETGNVQPAGPHRFNLSSVAFNGEVDDVPAGDFGDVVEEFAEGVLVDGRVFGRRVGEHQSRRVEEVRGIGRGVGQHVPVFIAIARVKVTALAVLRHGGAEQQQQAHHQQ